MDWPPALVRVSLSCGRRARRLAAALVAWLRAREPALDAERTAGLVGLLRLQHMSTASGGVAHRAAPRLLHKALLDALLAEAAPRVKEARLYAVGRSGALRRASGAWGSFSDGPSNGDGRDRAPALYVVGGMNSGAVSLLERFDPTTGTWEQLAAARSAAGVVLGGKLYAVGGWDGRIRVTDPSSGVGDSGAMTYSGSPGVVVLDYLYRRSEVQSASSAIAWGWWRE